MEQGKGPGSFLNALCIYLNPVFVFTGNSDEEGNMNIDVEKSDDSDEEGNDYVNTKGMAHIGTLNRI